MCDQEKALAAGVALLERAIDYALGSLRVVTPATLCRPTPCADWNLQHLLDHLADSLQTLNDAASGHIPQHRHKCWAFRPQHPDHPTHAHRPLGPPKGRPPPHQATAVALPHRAAFAGTRHPHPAAQTPPPCAPAFVGRLHPRRAEGMAPLRALAFAGRLDPRWGEGAAPLRALIFVGWPDRRRREERAPLRVLLFVGRPHPRPEEEREPLRALMSARWVRPRPERETAPLCASAALRRGGKDAGPTRPSFSGTAPQRCWVCGWARLTIPAWSP